MSGRERVALAAAVGGAALVYLLVEPPTPRSLLAWATWTSGALLCGWLTFAVWYWSGSRGS